MLRPDDPRLGDPTLQDLILRLRGLDVGQQEIEQAAYYREKQEAFLLQIRGDEMSRSPHYKRWLERKEKAKKEEEEEEEEECSICLDVFVDPTTQQLGCFATEEEAARACDNASARYKSTQHKNKSTKSTSKFAITNPPKDMFLHNLPSKLSYFLEMAKRIQEQVFRSDEPLDGAPDSTGIEVDHHYVVSGNGSTCVCATDLSRVGNVNRAQAVSSTHIVQAIEAGGQCLNYTPEPKEDLFGEGKLDVLPKLLLDFKSLKIFALLCPHMQSIIQSCRAVNDFCSGAKFPLKVHILLGEGDVLILKWLATKFDEHGNPREERMVEDGVEFILTAPGDIPYHQDRDGSAVGRGGKVNNDKTVGLLNTGHHLRTSPDGERVEGEDKEKVVRTDSFLTIRGEPGPSDQNFEVGEAISMNGIGKREIFHSPDSQLLPTVDSVRHGVELQTGWLATNMSLTTYPLPVLPVLTGQDGEFHGRSSIATPKEHLASKRCAAQILPAGRQPIEKAPMVVSINITCFGRDEQKKHVLVAELLRHATNCVA
jgi:hypothetical protein